MLIWWLSQNEMESVNKDCTPFRALRPYIHEEFQSMYGRAGRGRLWVSTELNDELASFSRQLVAPDRFETPLGKYLTTCGGIVVRNEDAEHCRELPGTVTDFELVRGRPSYVAAEESASRIFSLENEVKTLRSRKCEKCNHATAGTSELCLVHLAEWWDARGGPSRSTDDLVFHNLKAEIERLKAELERFQ